MIKEIEVGGVKHSITLADDMIGSGLKRDDGNRIAINFGSGLTISSEHALEVNTENIVGPGLLASGGKISLSLPSIVAKDQGLMVASGGLAISGVAVSRILSGSGLTARGDVLQVNVATTSGLTINNGKIEINIPERSSGLRLYFTEDGKLDVTQ